MIRHSRPSRPGSLHHSVSSPIHFLQCLVLAAFVLFGIGSRAMANGVDVDGFLRDVERQRGKVETFSARFVQKKTLELFGDTKISKGTILYKAPRQMIWKYLEPDKTQMRMERDSVSFYFPELEQIEVYPAKQGDGASNFFFVFEASADELKGSFEVTIGRVDRQLTRIDLLPKVESIASQIMGLSLWLDKSDYLPRRILIRDVSGDTTDIEFSDIQVNEPITDDALQFDAPQGTKTIENGSGAF